MDRRTLRDKDPDIKDAALAAALGRDAAVLAVGPPPQASQDIPWEDTARLTDNFIGTLRGLFGFVGVKMLTEGEGGDLLIDRVEGMLQEAYLLGVKAAQNTRLDYDIAQSKASTAGILKGLLGNIGEDSEDDGND
jgi:hypothetical protein